MMRWLSCVLLLGLLAGCSDPLSTVPRIGEVDLNETPETAAAVAVPTAAKDTRPLFERLLSKREEAVEAPDGDADVLASEGAQAAPQEAKPRALYGFLKPKAAEKADEKEAGQGTVVASYSPEADVREPRARGGLFNRSKPAATTGPDAQEIAYGTPLAFGQIARVCGVSKKDLGREVEQSGKYKLYDSAFGSTAPRAFYITGFDDGCARQVTGALALFGTASSHEAMRYGAPFEGKPYSKTDKAYEKVKRAVCRAGKGKPCGAQMGKLEKTTAFVTVYDRFVGGQHWHNVLLHDGAVMAMN